MLKHKLNIIPKDVEPRNIVSGPPVYVRQKFFYVGHACTTYSVEQAISIMDYIGQITKSDDCLPFAVALVENGELIAVSEDNGEFGAGDILASALKKFEGFNVLVCVSKHVSNCFVSDMFQAQKHRAVKDASSRALDILYSQLVSSSDGLANAAAQQDADHNAMSVPSIPRVPHSHESKNGADGGGVGARPLSSTRQRIERFRDPPANLVV